MTLAQAAQKAIELGGKYDGHELPDDINAFTKTSATSAGGPGPDGRRAATTTRATGRSQSYVAGFAEVEVDVETGKYQILDYLAVADVGTVINPRSLERPDPRRLDARHRPRDRPEVGLRPALRRAAGQAVPLQQAADDSRRAAAVCSGPRSNIPDPETPVGARGIGEPPVGAGCCAVLNAHRRRGRRRDLPARAGDAGHDPDGARSGQAGARAADGAHLGSGSGSDSEVRR